MADVQEHNSSNPEDWASREIDPNDAPRAVREYLDTLNDEAFGAATTAKAKFTAHADPASRWTAARKGPAFFAYSDNDPVDTDHGIIVPSRQICRANRLPGNGRGCQPVEQDGRGARHAQGDRPDRRALRPEAGLGGGRYRLWLDRQSRLADARTEDPPLHPGLPLPGRVLRSDVPRGDKGERTDGTFFRSDFTWDEENDRYVCPEGKEMLHTRRTYSDPARPRRAGGPASVGR